MSIRWSQSVLSQSFLQVAHELNTCLHIWSWFGLLRGSESFLSALVLSARQWLRLGDFNVFKMATPSANEVCTTKNSAECPNPAFRVRAATGSPFYYLKHPLTSILVQYTSKSYLGNNSLCRRELFSEQRAVLNS